MSRDLQAKAVDMKVSKSLEIPRGSVAIGVVFSLLPGPGVDGGKVLV